MDEGHEVHADEPEMVAVVGMQVEAWPSRPRMKSKCCMHLSKVSKPVNFPRSGYFSQIWVSRQTLPNCAKLLLYRTSMSGSSKRETYAAIVTQLQSFFKKYDVDIVGKEATIW